ncbi:MAG: type VI secretion system tip protein VgrG [Natronospirillum sp.]
MTKRAKASIKQLPVNEISSQLASIGGSGKASQFFVQLAEHSATSTLVLSAQTDEQAMVTLHEDFRLQLTVLVQERLDTDALLGRPAVFMRLEAGKLVPLHGVVAGFHASRTSSDPAALDVVLASPLHLLKKQRHNRVFVDRSALDIAAQLLRDALGHLCDLHVLADQTAPAAMITQYQETDYDFIRRILAWHGMFIHLSQTEERTALYLVNRLSDVPEAKRIVRLPYMTNSGAAKDKDHISHIEQHYALAPSAVSLKDYNPDTGFDLNIAGRSETGGTAGETEHWGLNYATPDEGEQLARRLAAHHYWQSQVLELVTSNAGLLPGHLINITGHAKHNGSYRVIKLAFAADQSSLGNSGAIGKEFKCRVWVLPLAVDYVPDCMQRSSLPLALSARITQEVDDQGCYRLRYPFDDRSEEDGYSSPPTRSLQAFGGSSHGMHFPLAESSEVVVSGLNGDLDRPVILGALFNHDAPDLINRDNARTNLVLTRGGQTFRMEDKPDHEHILLATPEDKNRLLLDATRDNHKVELASEEGDVEILAGKNLLLQSGSSVITTVGEDQQIEIGGSETLLTEEGDIQLNAGQDLMMDAAQNIQWRAEEGDVNISTGANLLMESAGQRFDVVNEGDYSVAVEQGSYLLDAAEDISVVSEGGIITLKNAAGLIQITADGNLLLEGPEIELQSDNLLVSGKALANN